ncbi:MAG: DUF2231 domain-containing protein [candidate division WOR-3 bacterium]
MELAKLHPFIVHFAIAFVITGVVLDILGFLLKKDSLKNAGFWLVILSVPVIWLANFSGHQAEELAEKTLEITGGESILEQHEKIGTLLSYLVTILGLVRLGIYLKPTNIIFILLYVILGLSSLGVTLYTGRLGGILVYDYGAGVKIKIENKAK